MPLFSWAEIMLIGCRRSYHLELLRAFLPALRFYGLGLQGSWGELHRGCLDGNTEQYPVRSTSLSNGCCDRERKGSNHSSRTFLVRTSFDDDGFHREDDR
mmetsp:Transcript_22665/g.47284  ORF Transcript_22665/g.47284 Transcript_22665/m.47284 type:complete len:100 (+) Transcript_22665:1878-2177(+)